MTDLGVDVPQLSRAAELLERQEAHMRAVGTHIETYCRVNRTDFGWLLQILFPANELLLDGAGQAVNGMAEIASRSGDTMRATSRVYVQTEQEVYERSRALVSRLGGSLPVYTDPRADVTRLGSAASTAGAEVSIPTFGAPSLDYAARVTDIARSATSLVEDTFSDVSERVVTLGRDGTVTERSDASSYLKAPVTEENWVEELRWKAGVILGSVDWVAEQLLGFSILEEYVFKPFSGDWQALGRASDAWGSAGIACREVGGNLAALPGQLTGWTGAGARGFMASIAVTSGVASGAWYACDLIGSVVSKVALAAKLAASGIASILKAISNKLTRMLIEASVPVAGWVVGAAEAVLLINDVMKWLGMINMLINAVLDAIEELIASRQTMADLALLVEDLLAGVASQTVRSAS